PEAEAQAPVEFRRDLWVRRLYDHLRLASERVADLNKQLGQSLEGALATAKHGMKTMEEELGHLTYEREQIRRQAAEKKIAKLDLREGDQRLEDLRARHKDLEKFAQRVDAVLKEAKSAETLGLAKQIERARLLDGEADFD